MVLVEEEERKKYGKQEATIQAPIQAFLTSAVRKSESFLIKGKWDKF